ncbi:MAG TPA: hypothetical protein VFR34_14245 [Paracoccaceae bacterium]|nr:hypothetical protein [Paracoccaceae bacterium]
MGACEYLLEHCCVKGERIEPLPPDVRRTHLEFVARGLGIDPAEMLGETRAPDSTG